MLDVKIRKGYLCTLAALADILTFYGFKISESILFGAVGGVDYKFGYNEKNNRTPYFRSIDLSNRFHSLEETCDLLGGTLKRRQLETKKQMLSIINNELHHQRPVIIFLDSFYLSYSPNYHKIHTGHSVIVDYLDFGKEIVRIGDNYVATLAGDSFKGDISLEEFIRAADLSETLSDSKYYLWQLIFDNSNLDRTLNPISNKIEEQLKAKVFDYQDTQSLRFLEKFGKVIEEVSEFDDEKLLEWSNHSDHLITRMNIVKNSFVVNMHFVEWLKENNLHNDRMLEIATELNNQWRVVYNLFLKFKFTRKRYVLKKINERLIIIKKIHMS